MSWYFIDRHVSTPLHRLNNFDVAIPIEISLNLDATHVFSVVVTARPLTLTFTRCDPPSIS